MNWDTIEGNWKQWKGRFKQAWAKLSDDELDEIEGKKDRLLGKLQERYGLAKEDAHRGLDEFLKKLES